MSEKDKQEKTGSKKRKQDEIESALQGDGADGDHDIMKGLIEELTAEEKDEYSTGLRVMPLIPLRGLTVFPYMVLHFDIGREKSVSALEKAMVRDQIVFLAVQRDAETDLPTKDDLYDIGCIVKIKQMLKLPGDSIRVLVEGVSRGVISDVGQEVPFFKVVVKQIDEIDYDPLPNNIEA
ncbi:MAG: LON peptidase substrate-binding domain-containing protein, partial [Clostridiales Family XIII bacterium]|nr:LON peptidase substrate-binding domain-containing protein [Clostridiales Family XIII bacterium]